MYSPKDVRNLLGVSPSTLVRYGDLFSEFLSRSATKKGGKRTYTEGDYYTLQQIRELYQQKKSTEEVRKALKGRTALTARDPIPLIPTGLADAFGKIDDRIKEQDTRMDNQDQRLDTVEKGQEYTQEFISNWVRDYNEFSHKPFLTRVWLTITGRRVAKPPSGY